MEIIISWPRKINIIAGIMLIVKAYEIVVFTYCGKNLLLYIGVLVMIMGRVSMKSIIMVRGANELITFTWSCTNFLVPKTNGLLLSFKS